jgi:hypothetical protein
MFINQILHRVIGYPMQLRENYKEKQLLKKKNSRLAKFLKTTRAIR